jgi:murein DD-endopeptidase MepM/ murein hydrolase activator NlpD
MHHGIDYGGSFNVLAAQDGKVVHIGWSPRGGGHVVILKHSNTFYTVYYHGAHRTPLKKGESVKAGQFIYRSGNTGASNGAHLHFEVRTPTRVWGTTKNPELFMVDRKPEPEPEPRPKPEPKPEPKPKPKPEPEPQPEPEPGPRPARRYGISGALKARDVRNVRNFFKRRIKNVRNFFGRR